LLSIVILKKEVSGTAHMSQKLETVIVSIKMNISGASDFYKLGRNYVMEVDITS
jgi:hypothetical protein